MNRKRLLVGGSALIGLGAAACVCIVAGVVLLTDVEDDLFSDDGDKPLVSSGNSGQPTSIVALAINLDNNSPAIQGYVGDLQQTPFVLASDSYLLLATDTNNRVISAEVQNGANSLSSLFGPVDWQNASVDSTRAEAIKRIALFLIDAELARLTALDGLSGGFSSPLYEPGVEASAAQLGSLFGQTANIAAQENSVLADTTLLLAPLGLTQNRVAGHARPSYGLRDVFLGFFGEISDVGTRNRERVLDALADLSPGEKEEAFQAVRSGFKSDASNIDEFEEQLKNGDLDNEAGQIHADLLTLPSYVAVAQQQGSTPGEVFHREGGVLATKGAEFNVAVIKTVLGDVFPGNMQQGFDLADKANEWLEYTRDIYQNPLGEAENYTRAELEALISERIKDNLAACCPDISDELADEIAGRVGGTIVGQIPTVAQQPDQPPVTTGGEGGGNGGEGQPVEPSGPAQVVVFVDGRFTENLSGQDFSLDTRFFVTADYTTGFISGSLVGTGVDPRRTVDCINTDNPGELFDVSNWEVDHFYEADFTVSFDTSSGAFSAPITISGSSDWQLTEPYSDERCVHLNAETTFFETWGGAGTISGVVSPAGAANVATDWEASGINGSGGWNGDGRVEPQ